MATTNEGSGVAPRSWRPTGEPVGAYPVMRTVQALERLAFGALSAPELAASLQFHQRTARRLLRRLEVERYVTNTGVRRRYQLTRRLAALGRQAIAHDDLPLLAAPWVATTPAGAPKYVGPLRRDPRTAPLVTELFRRRAQLRASHSELARWLTSLGVPTGAGRSSWSMRGVKDILANRVYLGIAFAADVENPDAHPALTDRETWRAAQRVGHRTRPRSPHPSPLSGLMRCAGCRYVMRSERRVQARGEVWAFSSRSVSGAHAWTCDAPAYLAVTDELEQRIVRAFLASVPTFLARVRRLTPRLDQAVVAAETAQTAFEQWRDDARIQARLGMDVYLDGVAARKDALTAALAELAREQAKADVLHLPRGLSDLSARWSALTPVEQRALLQIALLCVLVERDDPARRKPFEDRVRVIWRGAPLELPRKGHVAWTPSPLPFASVEGEPWVLQLPPPPR
jgi:Recombinase/Recombinase zinc beta ribbon domain